MGTARPIFRFLAACVVLCTVRTVLAAETRPVDFPTDIIPVLTKAGCNAGACHGAAIGRGGFRLSLYGGDPAFDYKSIVQELEGRRVNLAHPERSLLLRKPTEYYSHEGGQRLATEGPGVELIRRWISAGATPGGSRSLKIFSVTPSSKVLAKIGERISLKAVAFFRTGQKVDVTRWTVFTAEDPAAVQIDPESALATVHRRGEHIIIARFLNRVVPMRLIIPLSDTPVDHSQQPRRNFIDVAILKKLETLRLPVSPPVTDAVFLRRATLDLTGRLPTAKVVHDFQADKRANKRQRLIDRLLTSEAFTDYWTLQFAKLLRIRSQPKDTQGALTFHRWLRNEIRHGGSMADIARSLITAVGDSHAVGPANFYRTATGPREQAEFVSELFLGVRLRCANCHNHPLDRWTQDDYHGFAAIFAKVKTGRVISISPRGEVTHPRTGMAAVPRIPGVRFLQSQRDLRDGRAAFAQWLTTRGNPYFARAIVNRLWKDMMGRGLVEPADDLRATNPATHPALLRQLADDFEQHGYDLRHTLRVIANSAAYARSERPVDEKSAGTSNTADDRYYSRRIVRTLEPEVLVDAVCDVTGVPEKYAGQAAGTRAVTLFDPNIPSQPLDILGRCDRNGSCESSGNVGGGLTAKLHWINGGFLNAKVAHPQGRLRQVIAAGATDAQIMDGFYIRSLSRPPTLQEKQFWSQQLARAKNAGQRRELLEDFVWSILSCREFQTR